jgi:hypothetical protein
MLFYALLLYKLYNGMLLYQMQPSFFYTRQDVFTWVFMQTGLHQWLINNPTGCLLFDVLFYTAPAIYLLHYRNNKSTAYLTAIYMLLINWLYVQCYTLYATNSIEGYLAWMLFPFLFMPKKQETFEVLFDGLRYFFLFFFASAGLWKLKQAGVFYPAEMTGILLYQHNQLLTNSPGYWQTNFIAWLIQHQYVAYALYIAATVIELSFIAGFFTKKYDKLLVLLFLLFLVTDYFVMRIPYFEVTPLLLTLYPGSKKSKAAY